MICTVMEAAKGMLDLAGGSLTTVVSTPAVWIWNSCQKNEFLPVWFVDY
jgi:hypothetical protein